MSFSFWRKKIEIWRTTFQLVPLPVWCKNFLTLSGDLWYSRTSILVLWGEKWSQHSDCVALKMAITELAMTEIVIGISWLLVNSNQSFNDFLYPTQKKVFHPVACGVFLLLAGIFDKKFKITEPGPSQSLCYSKVFVIC